MTKEEAQHVAEATFGPKAEAVRVSSIDRNGRYVIALGSYRLSRTERPVPLLLGSGDSWESALDCSRTTPNGLKAIEDIQKVKDFVTKAMDPNGTKESFTEWVREQALEEAKAKGANDAVLSAINHKFDEAKKKLNEKKND